ncbi:MAG: hypothetical protein SFU25_11510 [Candidatus Caenarcaniphilales bacterium]|nr:hypothetical protein [Candidatus Caenarcaniphilales bacterium]
MKTLTDAGTKNWGAYTVKSGIIASKWRAFYNGNPYFLVDCKLFPGSSGSIIITKATGLGSAVGSFEFFQFLGVYSGEFYRRKETIEFDEMTLIRKETYNIGIAWYYDIIEQIIN